MTRRFRQGSTRHGTPHVARHHDTAPHQHTTVNLSDMFLLKTEMNLLSPKRDKPCENEGERCTHPVAPFFALERVRGSRCRILKHVHEDDTPVGTPTGRETGSIASLLEGAVDSGSEEAKSEASAVSLELTQKPSTPPTKPS